ncbi:MAG TPA: acetyl-CoA carboxylase, carboxyltransferase subunit beta [Thermodesulfobacteriota bacterium]|nr:acetyl-CoA carboxylase, carboxyltransferase subunit beta [Thermodesulfobacteriota bacterium]
MAWFTRDKAPKPRPTQRKVRVPEGLWSKCENCSEIIYNKELERNLSVCPKCHYHFRISAADRIALVADEGSFAEFDAGLAPADPLGFVDARPYPERIAEAQKKAGTTEAVVCGDATIEGIPVVLAVFEFGFMGGSMGSVAGEKVTRAVERAIARRCGLVIFSSSGGARMQEGIFSLMQMAKTSAALARLSAARLPYLSVLTDPTTGGVTASFAMLGDVILAEPRALIGFAGPRVIEQTIRQTLPDGFQRSEYLLEHGMIDLIVERKRLKETLATLLRFLSPA